ncbi:MAG TPA: hypothetical protein VMT76_11520 [Puia sp.]|nr:hypothetical protein [Puia sp.]
MKYKVIIQLTGNEEALIKSVYSQINNLLKALSENVDIELVCHGNSLPFVINEDERWSNIISQLLSKSVRIVACENMLAAQFKNKTDLFPGIETVPAAIAELVVKQQEGWSYIKAG